MGFNLSSSIEAESGNDTSTNNDSNDDEITRFVPNEVIEGYILGGEWARCLEEVTVNMAGFDRPSVSWGDDLGDYESKVEANNYNDQQKLHLLAMLFKSTFGAKQSEMNEGYGVGWDNDESPPKPIENDNVHYANEFRHLPAFDWDSLDGGEREAFEEDGIDPSGLGFDRNHGGPKLPVINGERVPIAVEDGDELQTALEMVNTIDFDNLTYCVENGSLQGTPSLGPSESDTDNAVESEESEDGGTNTMTTLVSSPSKVGEFTVDEIKGAVSDITSRRTLQQMLQAEEQGKDRSVTERIEQRIRAVEGDDEADTEEASDDDDEESVENVEGLSDSEMNLASTLIETGKAEDLDDAVEQIRSL